MTSKSKIRDRYVELFETAIDTALAGHPQKIAFTSDVVLELYLGEDERLHWRSVNGNSTGEEGRNGAS